MFDFFSRLAIGVAQTIQPIAARTVGYDALRDSIVHSDSAAEVRKSFAAFLSRPSQVNEVVSQDPKYEYVSQALKDGNGFAAFIIQTGIKTGGGERQITDELSPEISGLVGYSRSTPVSAAHTLVARRLYSPNATDQNGAPIGLTLSSQQIITHQGEISGVECPLIALEGRANEAGIAVEHLKIANAYFLPTQARLTAVLNILAAATSPRSEEKDIFAVATNAFSGDKKIWPRMQQLFFTRGMVANHVLPELLRQKRESMARSQSPDHP